ncbi:PilT/PilU family type 4a pilus ATPase [Candidatus Oleimmundimicrobium sp.]|uniref:type IV pilus twitching motility protein PilT n=1 Tax=Candidatus Oleimmundimicrobium sp. TaxID=3060597 RepID=UPI0027247968|nr:PilT/PilU family type 4a pilus ATPase [Candidatus Oleimmundimicrobium sp.]MDO8885649.1 PilT/PilU family type 4a pilus ATPase [Candidatus Oleimmundimicrobium sp.]
MKITGLLSNMLKEMMKEDASDIHLKAGSPPCFRVQGRLVLSNSSSLSASDVEEIARLIMGEERFSKLKDVRDFDFAHSLSDLGRFRINISLQRESVAIAIRKVFAGEHLNIDELGLPPVIKKLVSEPRGLVLVTGTAGSGKTTTLAAMINHINKTRRAHIVTIEDPIEVLHEDNLSFINQREIGMDTESYQEALKRVVRQDPDVILIGEMRDIETVRAAISAAEIGHLVFSTLHTIDATETINRIIDFFPPYQQNQIRIMLASTLKGIVSLRLLPKVGGGRVPAVEAMVNTATTRDYILKEAETSKIKEAIAGGDYYGMMTFEQSLEKLYQDGKITLEDALNTAANSHDFKLMLQQKGLV